MAVSDAARSAASVATGSRSAASRSRSIAAVNGVAVGVGLTMILPFDIILASDQARMGMFFVRMGLVPELASSYYVVQRVGFAKASEMCLTGKLYPATELAGTGLVNDVVPHDQLLHARVRDGRRRSPPTRRRRCA